MTFQVEDSGTEMQVVSPGPMRPKMRATDIVLALTTSMATPAVVCGDANKSCNFVRQRLPPLSSACPMGRCSFYSWCRWPFEARYAFSVITAGRSVSCRPFIQESGTLNDVIAADLTEDVPVRVARRRV